MAGPHHRVNLTDPADDPDTGTAMAGVVKADPGVSAYGVVARVLRTSEDLTRESSGLATYEVLLTLRAILNHLRALTEGHTVDESAPIEGVGR